MEESFQATVDGDVNMPQAGLCGEKLLLMEKGTMCRLVDVECKKNGL